MSRTWPLTTALGGLACPLIPILPNLQFSSRGSEEHRQKFRCIDITKDICRREVAEPGATQHRQADGGHV